MRYSASKESLVFEGNCWTYRIDYKLVTCSNDNQHSIMSISPRSSSVTVVDDDDLPSSPKYEAQIFMLGQYFQHGNLAEAAEIAGVPKEIAKIAVQKEQSQTDKIPMEHADREALKRILESLDEDSVDPIVVDFLKANCEPWTPARIFESS